MILFTASPSERALPAAAPLRATCPQQAMLGFFACRACAPALRAERSPPMSACTDARRRQRFCQLLAVRSAVRTSCKNASRQSCAMARLHRSAALLASIASRNGAWLHTLRCTFCATRFSHRTPSRRMCRYAHRSFADRSSLHHPPQRAAEIFPRRDEAVRRHLFERSLRAILRPSLLFRQPRHREFVCFFCFGGVSIDELEEPRNVEALDTILFGAGTLHMSFSVSHCLSLM